MSHIPTRQGMQQWIADMQGQKLPLQSAAHGFLKKWRATHSDAYLNMMTFRHVKTYWETGVPGDRLQVALADIGYTQAEIDALKTDGKTLESIVDEILNRGVARDDDE